MNELEVVGVRVELPNNLPFVLLREQSGERFGRVGGEEFGALDDGFGHEVSQVTAFAAVITAAGCV